MLTRVAILFVKMRNSFEKSGNSLDPLNSSFIFDSLKTKWMTRLVRWETWPIFAIANAIVSLILEMFSTPYATTKSGNSCSSFIPRSLLLFLQRALAANNFREIIFFAILFCKKSWLKLTRIFLKISDEMLQSYQKQLVKNTNR